MVIQFDMCVLPLLDKRVDDWLHCIAYVERITDAYSQ